MQRLATVTIANRKNNHDLFRHISDPGPDIIPR
jgi:hypothetical protein